MYMCSRARFARERSLASYATEHYRLEGGVKLVLVISIIMLTIWGVLATHVMHIYIVVASLAQAQWVQLYEFRVMRCSSKTQSCSTRTCARAAWELCLGYRGDN